MAIVIPQRKKYKPRAIVEYVRDNVLYLRSNCDTINHPNTPLQQCFRNRFMLMHTLQQQIAPLFQRGFHRERSDKNRWVGAYHVALGRNMTQAARLQDDGITWRVDFSRLSLCELKSKPPQRMTVQRKGALLLFSYKWSGKAERVGMLWAVYNRKCNQWVHGIVDTRLEGKTMACAIPEAWHKDPLEVFVGLGMDAEGRGKLRGTHHFTFDESEGTVTVKGGVREAVQSASPRLQGVTVWHVVWNDSSPWAEITDTLGVTLKVKVWYWLE